MRNTLPLLSRPLGDSNNTKPNSSSQLPPSIRLVTAAPSATGLSSEARSSFNNSMSYEGSSWGSFPSCAAAVPAALTPPPALKPVEAAAKRRLVPKKSKLGLFSVGGAGGKDKENKENKYVESVAHSTFGRHAANPSVEIYVDPTMDPDIGEIIMVKKKKSRAALDGMRWGPLGEVTNVPKGGDDNNKLKVKGEDKGGWWSIGRGRKDSKDKSKEGKEKANKENARAKSPEPRAFPPRSKTPEPLKLGTDSRARFNSLDSGILLNSPATAVPPPHVQFCEPEVTFSRAGTPTAGGLLAPPPTISISGVPDAHNQGSIAVRAMRSVRSLARIGSWAQLRKESGSHEEKEKEVKTETKKDKKAKKEKKEKEKEEKKDEKKEKKAGKKEKKEKAKKEKEKKERDMLRVSTSSFEAGALSPIMPSSPLAPLSPLVPVLPPRNAKESSRTLGKKGSILGLGLPSSMRLPSLRSGSTASSVLAGSQTQANQPQTIRASDSSGSQFNAATTMQNRLSVDSGGILGLGIGRGRSGSVMSTVSSLRPVSTISNHSRTSNQSGTSQNSHSNGSGCSVKWDEEGLQTVREVRRKEREEKAKDKEEKKKSKKEKKSEKVDCESRRSSEGRKRTAITDIFPDIAGSRRSSTSHEAGSRRSSTAVHPQLPLLTVEEATCDGHGTPEDFDAPLHEMPVGTPSKKARPRPVSEQMLGKSRPVPMYQDDEDNAGVLTLLDAATNDLAQLIMTLGLEATPGNTPNSTPLKHSPIFNLSKVGLDENLTDKLPESPLSKTLKRSMASITSLRPYAQSLRKSGSQLLLGSPKHTIKKQPSKSATSTVPQALIGQQIAPWSKLVEGLSPTKKGTPNEKGTKENRDSLSPASISSPKSLRPSTTPPGTFRKGHRRQMTPAPEPEPAPVFHPLRPAARPKTAKNVKATKTPSLPESVGNSPDSSIEVGRGGVVTARGEATIRGAPSSHTFGSLSPASSNKKKASTGSFTKERKVPIPPETRRILGMSGTLGGGSDLPDMYAVPEVDASDPDSDIPDELQFILKGSNSDNEASFRNVVAPLDDEENDTFSFPLSDRTRDKRHAKKVSAFGNLGPSGLPPTDPLPIPTETSLAMELPPVFRARVVDEDDNHTGFHSISDRGVKSEEDTTNSFDFTGELKKLDETAGSDRRSFVEQLEHAFKTPAKVELAFDLLGRSLQVGGDAPPIPKLPFAFSKNGESEEDKDLTPSQSTSGFDSRGEMFKVSKLVDEKEPTMTTTETEVNSGSRSVLDLCTSGSQILNVKEPSLLPPAEDESVSKLNVSTTSTDSSNRSNGELNTSFKFGGKPKPSADSEKAARPLTLSDIIPPLSHARSLAESSLALEEDSVLQSIYAEAKTRGAQPRSRLDSNASCEDSVLKSIYANAKTGGAQPRSRLNSNASSKRRNRVSARSFLVQSRPASMASFTGLDSFEEIRRTFEFSGPRPNFYLPPASNSNRRINHRQQDSVLSIASVSSYGRVTNPGITDPFGFILPSLQERPSTEDISSATFSMSVDDTFSFIHHRSRRTRVDSDASSFYFRPPLPNKNYARGHRRQESSMSNGGPPISFYNRSFGAHRRNDSNASVSSVALSYAMHGASGGRAAWARHRQDASIDSVMSDMSALRLGRPGLGDKMFDTTFEQGMPLSSISASPPEPDRSSLLPREYAKSSSYDSIMDLSNEPKSSEDSLFDKSGHQQPSITSESVFGGNDFRTGFQPRYRPVSVISLGQIHSPPKEDDTWISMIGGDGGHVRRNSVASVIQSSPCNRVEKRKKARFVDYEQGFSPKKPRVVEPMPSIVSTASSKFGGERMIQATKGLLERQSLEDSCLIAEGEDSSISFRSAPVFSRPVPAGRSRSSTCTSSSGGETPPLSSDGSSISGGSQSSIDLGQLDSLLANATFPVSNPSMIRNRARARARGAGHHHRYSAARVSRASVYETIEEEGPASNSPVHTVTSGKFASPTATIQPVVVVDQSETGSMDVTVSDSSFWNSETGAVTMNKYYTLRHEAEDVVVESKRQWADTPFSVYAVQNFDPPRNPEGMKALLQHSIQNFGPLPSDLRRRRSRTHSRPSPYPLARTSRVFYPPEPMPNHTTSPLANQSIRQMPSAVLQERNVNSNVPPSPAPSFKVKAFSPDKSPAVKRSAVFGQPPLRPRVPSGARRAALGWTKRSAKTSNGDQRNAKTSNGDQKENKENKENVSYGSIKTPGDSLRLNRPRPRGRATPATQMRPIRV